MMKVTKEERLVIRELVRKGQKVIPERVEQIVAVRRKASKLPPVSRGRNTLSGGVVIEEF